MGTNTHCLLSNEMVAYVIGESSEEEKNRIDNHLLNCSACQREVKELREAWAMIPYKLEEVEVPTDLKEEVMQAIFPLEEKHKPESKWTGLMRWRLPKRFSPYSWVTVALIVALVGVFWNNITLRQQLLTMEQQTQLPAQILQAYSLKTEDPSFDAASGNVWMFEQGSSKKLVFHLQGLKATNGSETYQVWLIQHGVRRSAGVFRVDANGNGVLTYQMKEEQLPFEAIGITLEPDADGLQPRGKKVLGT